MEVVDLPADLPGNWFGQSLGYYGGDFYLGTANSKVYRSNLLDDWTWYSSAEYTSSLGANIPVGKLVTKSTRLLALMDLPSGNSFAYYNGIAWLEGGLADFNDISAATYDPATGDLLFTSSTSSDILALKTANLSQTTANSLNVNGLNGYQDIIPLKVISTGIVAAKDSQVIRISSDYSTAYDLSIPPEWQAEVIKLAVSDEYIFAILKDGTVIKKRVLPVNSNLLNQYGGGV
jgi:hypothetical protein